MVHGYIPDLLLHDVDTLQMLMVLQDHIPSLRTARAQAAL